MWVQKGDDIIGITDFDILGMNVSPLNFDGTVIACSAVRWGGTSENMFGGVGQVRVYALNERKWELVGSPLSGKIPNGLFGNAVGKL